MRRGTAGERLFVYGSLTAASRLTRLLGRQTSTIPARLEGYLRARARYFYIVRNDGHETEGVVVLGLSDGDLAILDGYEDAPHLYTREPVEVIADDGRRLRCWTYLPTQFFWNK